MTVWPWLVALMTSSLRHAHGRDAYLLPSAVRPVHYDVRLLYDVDPATNFSFYGSVDITLSVRHPTSKIVVHKKDPLCINPKGISVTGDDFPTVIDVSETQEFSFLNMELDRPLLVGGNYTLSIPFYGNLAKGLEGVYISSYVDLKSNATNYLVTTLFEPIFARTGFPCFDEPALKATFKISVGHHRRFRAVSNMPQERTVRHNLLKKHWTWNDIVESFNKPESEFVWDTFRTSVPMSAYLVAYVVSDFEYVISPPGLSEVEFRIWANREALDQTKYAATAGPRILTHYADYFGIPFPLPKQDMVAIPDFGPGAMENWGLVTFKEQLLLYNERTASVKFQENIMGTIAHELSHQWFGNLVTMKWWSDLWLNEGFATYICHRGLDDLEPSWRSGDYYTVTSMQSLMNVDSLASSHPVSVHLDRPEQSSELFDEISYMKGGILVRMIAMVLGEESFRTGLHNYLVKYSYNNAAKDDLWAELAAAANENGQRVQVKEIMDNWLTQTGYPIVTVERNYDDQTMTIKQKRYLNMGAVAPTNTSWWIPLSILSEGRPGAGARQRDFTWMDRHQGLRQGFQLAHSSKPQQWILLNYDIIAPYRINYDQRNWELLIRTLNSDRFEAVPLMARVRLLSDAFELAWSGILDYDLVFRLTSYIKHETELLPFTVALQELTSLQTVFKRSADYAVFQRYIRKIVTPEYFSSGGLSKMKVVNADDMNSVKLQALLATWACENEVQGCDDNAALMFQRWMEGDPDDGQLIPGDLRRTIFCRGIAVLGDKAWNVARRRLRRASSMERVDLIMGMACTEDERLLQRYLEMTITGGSEKEIRIADADGIFNAIATTKVGFDIVKRFIYTRFEEVYKAFGNGMQRLGKIIKSLLTQITTSEELSEFLVWQKQYNHLLKEHQLMISQQIERTKITVHWVQRNRRYVAEKLRLYSE